MSTTIIRRKKQKTKQNTRDSLSYLSPDQRVRNILANTLADNNSVRLGQGILGHPLPDYGFEIACWAELTASGWAVVAAHEAAAAGRSAGGVKPGTGALKGLHSKEKFEFIYLSVCLSICLSIYLSIYLPIYLSICLSV